MPIVFNFMERGIKDMALSKEARLGSQKQRLAVLKAKPGSESSGVVKKLASKIRHSESKN